MADTLTARVTLRASQGLKIEVEAPLFPSGEAYQPSAYQNDAFQIGGSDIFRNLTLLQPGRP